MNSTKKHDSILKKEKFDINHNESEHTMGVQRSGYIAFDQDISNMNLDRLAHKIRRKEKLMRQSTVGNKSSFFSYSNYKVMDRQFENPKNKNHRPKISLALDPTQSKACDEVNKLAIRYNLTEDVEVR